MINIAVVEDDNKDRERLISLLEKENSAKELSIFPYVNPVLLIDNYRGDFDIIFLDIKMPMMDGMEAARRIRERDKDVIIVFITSLAQFALQGYEVQAFDFLVKPIEVNEFNLKFKRILERVRKDDESSLLINIGKEKRRLFQRDICYIESRGHHLTIYTSNQEFTLYDSLSRIEKELDSRRFSRCNNCYLVNLKNVVTLMGYECIVQVGDKEVSLQVSQPRKKDFQASLSRYIEGV